MIYRANWTWLVVWIVTASTLTGCSSFALRSPSDSLSAIQEKATPAKQVVDVGIVKPKRDKRLSSTVDPKQAAQACVVTAREFKSEKLEQDAIKMFERAREHDPEVKGISRDLAVLYDRAGEYFKAEKEYKLAIGQHPKDADLHNDFGFFHYLRGKFAEAEKQYRRSLELNDKNARAWTNLGMALAKQDRWQESEEAFATASGPAAAAYNVALLMANAGQSNEALAKCEKAIQLQPTLDQAHDLRMKLQPSIAHADSATGTTK